MSYAFDTDLQQKISQTGIIAVLIIDDPEDAVPVAKALLDGGVYAIELTLRTESALESLRRIRSELPEVIAGVGTVLFPSQIPEIAQLQAHFAVSPGTNPKVISEAKKHGISFAPGIATPTDIEAALENNCRLLKFFPAEPSGGLNYLRSVAAPYAHLGLKYIPLGGVNEKNLSQYISDPLIAAIGGSWLAPKDAIAKGDWKGITARAAHAVSVIRSARKPN